LLHTSDQTFQIGLQWRVELFLETFGEKMALFCGRLLPFER
jgi:hypothetical protein